MNNPMTPQEVGDIWLTLNDLAQKEEKKEFKEKSKLVASWQRKFTPKDWGDFVSYIKEKQELPS